MIDHEDVAYRYQPAERAVMVHSLRKHGAQSQSHIAAGIQAWTTLRRSQHCVNCELQTGHWLPC